MQKSRAAPAISNGRQWLKRAALLLHRLRTGRKIALIVLDNVVWLL